MSARVISGKARTEHFMSAFHPKAAEERTSQIVCLVPIADIPLISTSALIAIARLRSRADDWTFHEGVDDLDCRRLQVGKMPRDHFVDCVRRLGPDDVDRPVDLFATEKRNCDCFQSVGD